jgi:hypothetical protein
MSRRKPITPLHLARRKVAAELGLAEDDWRTIRLSTFMCVHEQLQEQVANHETIDVSYLKQIDQSIEELRAQIIKPTAAPGEPPFMLQIVAPRLFTYCKRCGYTEETSEPVPPPDHAKPKPFEPPEPLMLPAPTDEGGDDVD